MAKARFQKIIDDGLCIGCGLCEAVAGSHIIRMVITDDDELRPQAHHNLSDKLVDKIYDVCPGTQLDGLPENLTQETLHQDLVWGPYMDMVLAWANDPNVRFEGATAGVLTALGQYLLAARRVNFIYHVGQHAHKPTFGTGKISRTEADVLSAAGSRYGPTALLADIDKILDMKEDFAIIGKPCDLGALRNLARHDKRVNQYVRYWLTPVCGGYLPGAAMNDFLERAHIQGDNIQEFRYRGQGCPGPTTAHLKNGSRQDWHYLDFWGENETAWSLPFRCKICPDGIGESADIAAADTWPGASPDREFSKTDPGTNSLIIRTWAGMEIVAGALDAGYLKINAPVNPDYMSHTQPHQLAKKKFMAARYRGLTKAGYMTPRTRGLRLSELDDTISTSQKHKQEQGAYERAVQARHPNISNPINKT